MQDSSAPHVHTQHTHNYSHHVPALACCSLIYNPNCYLGRLIGWSGAKQIQQRLNVRLDHMTWFLQETPLSSQTDHNMNFLTVKQYSKKVTTLMWCNDVQPHQRSVPDNSVTDSRALLCCRNTECQGWSKAVIFNRLCPKRHCFLSVTPPIRRLNAAMNKTELIIMTGPARDQSGTSLQRQTPVRV